MARHRTPRRPGVGREPGRQGRYFLLYAALRGFVDKKCILLVEDSPDDEALAVRALKKSNVMNEVVVARDGVEALDYLFATGAHAGRDTSVMPQGVLLDLKLPRVDGL